MPKISQVIRDGLGNKDLTEIKDAVIWSVDGTPPKGGRCGIYRFGSPSDIAWFHILRLIAYLDAVIVPFFLGILSVIPRWMEATESWPHYCFWLFVDLVYGVGSILFQLRVSTVDLATAFECVEPKRILQKRISSLTFWLDVTSLFGILWVPTGWHSLACFHLLRLWRLTEAADDLYELHESRFVNSSPTKSMLTLLCKMIVMIHWLACAWFFSMALNTNKELAEELKSNERWFGGDLQWVYINCFSVGARMLAGWGWPAPLEDNLTKEERIFHAIGGPFSGVCAAYIFSQIIVISTSASSAQRHLDYLSDIAANVTSLKLPDSLEKRVLQYHTFLSVHNVVKNTALGESISADLNKEVRLYMFEPIITASFFEEMTAADAVKMVMAFKEDAYAPDEYVFRKGDIGKEVYFIMRGSVKVLAEDGLLITTLGYREYFGEIGLLHDAERTASVQSRCYSLVAVLTRDDIFSTFESAPAARKRIYNGLRRTHQGLGYTLPKDKLFPKLSSIVPSTAIFNCCGHAGNAEQSSRLHEYHSDDDDLNDEWGIGGEKTPLLSTREASQTSEPQVNQMSLLTSWLWKQGTDPSRSA
mmetsp:Transcript_81573/g.127340  ORF Transcript_81573/g.127340 Transcript_81573/m.127340 type:complete len:588 (+) Transcript_81573:108-1871(+)